MCHIFDATWKLLSPTCKIWSIHADWLIVEVLHNQAPQRTQVREKCKKYQKVHPGPSLRRHIAKGHPVVPFSDVVLSQPLPSRVISCVNLHKKKRIDVSMNPSHEQKSALTGVLQVKGYLEYSTLALASLWKRHFVEKLSKRSSRLIHHFTIWQVCVRVLKKLPLTPVKRFAPAQR